MNDILNSITRWFKEKTTSPFYGTFIFSLILWNWKFFYILFWESEEKLPLPKIEYVQMYLLNYQNYYQHLISFLILPIISSYIILWWLPYLTNLAHKKHLEFYYKRRLIIDNAKLDYERRAKKNLESMSELKKGQALAKKEIEKNISLEDRWASEFETYRNRYIYEEIKDIVYKNSGKTRTWDSKSETYKLMIDANSLAEAHSRGLIEISGSEEDEIIKITEKGKFFISKYLNNR